MITLRAPHPDDLAPLTEAVNLPGVRRGTLRLPFTGQGFLEQRLMKAAPGVHNVVGCWDNHPVALGTLMLSGGRQRHAGEIFLFVHDDHWGKGIGRALLGGLLDLADNWYGLVRVSLDVAATNAAAIQLYETAGFVREGVKRSDTICEGKLEDSILMARLVPVPAPPGRDGAT